MHESYGRSWNLHPWSPSVHPFHHQCPKAHLEWESQVPPSESPRFLKKTYPDEIHVYRWLESSSWIGQEKPTAFGMIFSNPDNFGMNDRFIQENPKIPLEHTPQIPKSPKWKEFLQKVLVESWGSWKIFRFKHWNLRTVLFQPSLGLPFLFPRVGW